MHLVTGCNRDGLPSTQKSETVTADLELALTPYSSFHSEGPLHIGFNVS